MCGRFTLTKPEDIKAVFHLDELPLGMTASYNIAPSQLVPIIYFDEARVKCDLMIWGLVPHWSKEAKSHYSTINARIETVTSKPTFRNLVGRHHCIIPTNGYYEWKPVGDGKIPMYIGLPDKSLFGLAGLWDEWHDNNTGQLTRTFTIITLPSVGYIQSIHLRMPALIMPEERDSWLIPRTWTDHELNEKLASEPYERLSAYAVSRLVNSPRNNDPSLITAV